MHRHFFKEVITQNSISNDDIRTLWKSDIQYASMGRHGLYHILKSIKVNSEKVMMPVYACKSVAEAIIRAGLIPVYYDISPNDLNGDIKDIKRCYEETQSKILIIPSLYGNPANLCEIEAYCQEQRIMMIDDAAQCFGAYCNGRPVGTFGNAGLFSFSAGKPTYGHMGCFFWSDYTVNIDRTRHWLLHRLKYTNYFYNRYGDYNAKKLYRFKIFDYFLIFLSKICNIENDSICKFEESLLSNIALDNIKRLKSFRNQYIKEAVDLFEASSFRVVTAQRGEPNNNKLVLIADSVQAAVCFMKILRQCNVYCSGGYKLLNEDCLVPTARSVYERVIEIPILISDYENCCDIKYVKKALEEYKKMNVREGI